MIDIKTLIKIGFLCLFYAWLYSDTEESILHYILVKNWFSSKEHYKHFYPSGVDTEHGAPEANV